MGDDIHNLEIPHRCVNSFRAAEVTKRGAWAELQEFKPFYTKNSGYLCQRVDTAIRQFELAFEDKGEHIACLEARKHFAWYLRGVAYSNYYKEQISSIQSMADIYRIGDGVRRDLK